MPSNHEGILWLVSRVRRLGSPAAIQVWVFRTRDAAQKFAKAKAKYQRTRLNGTNWKYPCKRATWGPDA